MANSTLSALNPLASITDADLFYDVQSAADFKATRAQITNQIKATGLTAAGNSQGTALVLTAELSEVTTTAASTGVLLPTPASPFGKVLTVANAGANTLAVYPPSGGQIDALGANAAFSLSAGKTCNFHGVSATQLYSEGLGSSLATPVSVSNGGTGAATLTTHGILLGEGTSAVTPTAAMTNGQLLVGQTTADPLPKTVSGDATLAASGALTNIQVNGVAFPASPSTNTVPVVTGTNTITYETVPVAAGGTGAASLTTHGILLGEGTSAVVPTAALTNGQLLVGVTSADPAPQTVSGDATLATNGALTVAKVNSTSYPAGGALTVGFVPTVSGVSAVTYQTPALAAGLFGDGSDSSQTFDGTTTILGLVPAASVYTLTRDLYLSAATINNGVTIKTTGYRIFCTGTLTNNGTIAANGGNAGNGSAGTGGGAGAVSTGNNLGQGGGGGTGGNSSGSSGGAGGGGVQPGPKDVASGGSGGNGGTGASGGAGGGTIAAVAASNKITRWLSLTPLNAIALMTGGTGGSGGSAGGNATGQSTGGGAGGGGGGGGGPVVIAAATLANGSGSITSNGGNGGNGQAPTANGGGGGGGGAGGGGWILLVFLSLTAGTITASAGSIGTKGGNGGGTGGTGVDGGSAGAGVVLKFNAAAAAFQ